jgi:hypothetical protein
MADFNRSEAYDLSLYSMPAFKPEREQKIEKRAPKPVQKSAIQIRRETMESALRAVKLFFVSAVLLVLFGSVLFSKISLVRLEKEATMLHLFHITYGKPLA